MTKALKPWLSLLCALLVFWPQLALSLSLIRDAETEGLLKDYTRRIAAVAGLDGEAVRIFLVNDGAINAFVAGGSNIFFHTGLLLASEEAETLIGVTAHEMGHIAGGHLARGSEAIADAQLSSVLGLILGAAIGLAGGGGDAAAGTMAASQHIAQRGILSFTRINEQSADQAALGYLDALGISATGLLSLMEKLRQREQLFQNQVDPYALTHPLSKERIAHIRGHLLQQQGATKSFTPRQDGFPSQSRYDRVLAKLHGFLDDPESVLTRYSGDETPPGLIARSIALHRQSKTNEAVSLLDKLLKNEADNPYLLELKGQFLSENARYGEALPYYRRASELLPDSGLILTDYARVLLAQETPDTALAGKILERSSLLDTSHSLTWQLLGKLRADQGQNGESALAYAEAALLRGEGKLAQRFASEALETLAKDSPALLRAQDAREEAIRLQKNQDK